MVYDVSMKVYFRRNNFCVTYLFLSFTGKIKCSKWGRPRDVYGLQLRDVSGPNNGTFKGRPRDVGENIF